MGRIKTFANGGRIYPTDLNAIQDDYEQAFSQYREVVSRVSRSVALLGTHYGPHLLQTADYAATPEVGDTLAAYATHAFRLEPTDYAAPPRAVKFRVRWELHVNAVAPACNITVGLYPVATWAGASGATPTVATIGTAITGSSFTFSTPSANYHAIQTLADFAAPAADWYVFCIQSSAAFASNCFVNVNARLQVRQV